MTYQHTKLCPRCNKVKKLCEFNRNGNRKGSPRARDCAECLRKRREQHIRKNPEQYAARQAWHRRNHLRTRYGVSVEEFDDWKASQGHGCAICKSESSDHGRALAVDHCHDTGKLRGLLCRKCNMALGCFKDDPALVAKAAAYLGWQWGVHG